MCNLLKRHTTSAFLERGREGHTVHCLWSRGAAAFPAGLSPALPAIGSRKAGRHHLKKQTALHHRQHHHHNTTEHTATPHVRSSAQAGRGRIRPAGSLGFTGGSPCLLQRDAGADTTKIGFGPGFLEQWAPDSSRSCKNARQPVAS